MAAKISFDVMTNNGRIYYGSVKSDIKSHEEMIDGKPTRVIDGDDIRALALAKYPTLKNQQFKIEINYVHYSE